MLLLLRSVHFILNLSTRSEHSTINWLWYVHPKLTLKIICPKTCRAFTCHFHCLKAPKWIPNPGRSQFRRFPLLVSQRSSGARWFPMEPYGSSLVPRVLLSWNGGPRRVLGVQNPLELSMEIWTIWTYNYSKTIIYIILHPLKRITVLQKKIGLWRYFLVLFFFY